MTKKFQAIPTNLITGFLGSGKTTTILQLLKSRPEKAHWAVLVNEFGDVGIDGAVLEQQGADQGIFIKEVPGGCICCAAGLPLQMALNLLIKQAQPERILIEPTGVGHPRKVMDTLTGEFYKNVLDLRATICLVEAHKLKEQKYLANETFIDQINIADVLLASKSDQAKKEDLDNFKEFCQAFEVPKKYTDCISYGDFPADVLDISRDTQRRVTFPDAHGSHNSKAEHPASELSQSHSGKGDPVIIQENNDNLGCDWRRFENSGQDYFGCGWLFNRSIVFDETRLEDWAKGKHLSRVKGLFRTANGWLLYNRSEGQFVKQKSAYSEDSRVEIIESEYHDWNVIEDDLLACIQGYSEDG